MTGYVLEFGSLKANAGPKAGYCVMISSYFHQVLQSLPL